MYKLSFALTTFKSWKIPDPADKSGNDWNIGKEVSEILSYPIFNTLKPVETGSVGTLHDVSLFLSGPGPRPGIVHSSLKPLISLVLHNTQLHCFRDRVIAILSVVFTANPVRPCKDLDRLLLAVHSCTFLFENGDFFPPVWFTVHTYSVKAVTENASFKKLSL